MDVPGRGWYRRPSMAEIPVDESRLPIVVVTFPDLVTGEQIRTLFARYDLLSRRHPRIAYIIDFTRFNPALGPGDVRRAIDERFREHREVLMRATLCEARIVPSMLIRTALAAFDAIAPQKWPCAHFATRREAEAWVAQHLARADAKGSPRASR